MSKLFICSLNVCGSDDEVKPETNIQNHISCSLLKFSLVNVFVCKASRVFLAPYNLLNCRN